MLKDVAEVERVFLIIKAQANTDGRRFKLGDIAVEVVFKDIKNVHLSVHPPTGRVSISAPKRMSLDTIRVFAISKLDWIRQQQKKLREQERETRGNTWTARATTSGASATCCRSSSSDGPPSIELKHNNILLHVRPGTGEEKREALVDAWYREQVKQAVPPLIASWEPQMGVKVARFFVQRMKTRWGSCNHQAAHIRLNTDLARKPRSAWSTSWSTRWFTCWSRRTTPASSR